MIAMRALFIGGTGIISTACTALAAERGIDLTILTRGRHAANFPNGVKTLTLDIDDPSAAAALAGGSFDAVPLVARCTSFRMPLANATPERERVLPLGGGPVVAPRIETRARHRTMPGPRV